MGFVRKLTGKSKDSTPIPTQDELKGLLQFTNTENNPNVHNMFGSLDYTRGADGRLTANQQLDPQLQQLMDIQFNNLAQGPSQYQPQENAYTQSMINGFSNRIGQRSGFTPEQSQGFQVQQPRDYELPGINQPMPEQEQIQRYGRREEPKDYSGLQNGNFGAAGTLGVMGNAIGGLLQRYKR